MKRFTIAAFTAALALLSLSANALTINDNGSDGEVLIFPYYNVNNGFTTSFNITNTTDAYKAMKVRFRESENSNDVLDFNLYLSPNDIWTLFLVKTADGGVRLGTADKSCTHPTIPPGGVEFRHGAYDSTDENDVREGYLELIEMGEIHPGAYIMDDLDKPQFIASQGILHDIDGVPFDCSVINKAWVQGVFMQGGAESNGEIPGDIHWVNPKPTGYNVQFVPSDIGYYGQATVSGSLFDITGTMEVITPPLGGVTGSSILIDAKNVAGFVAEPISVLNYSTAAQHYLSSDEHFYLLPSLASGNVFTSEDIVNDPIAGTSVLRVVAYGKVARDWGMDDTEVLPRKSVPSGINPFPIADALLVTGLGNQYFLGQDTFTDWVISAPMRKHGIYNDYQYIPAPTVPLLIMPVGAIAIGLP